MTTIDTKELEARLLASQREEIERLTQKVEQVHAAWLEDAAHYTNRAHAHRNRAERLEEALRQIAQGDRMTTTHNLASVAYTQCVGLARAALQSNDQRGVIRPPLQLSAAQKDALSKPDTRTEAEIIRDGVAFVMGEGVDEGTKAVHSQERSEGA